MNLDFYLTIHNCNNEEISSAIMRMMEKEGFSLADDELWRQALENNSEILHKDDKQLISYRFLISPEKTKWSMTYPTGAYSDFQFFGLELSRELGCITMVILRDNSSGWGYEIYRNGQVLDKYHTDPYTSPRLHEREELAIEPNHLYHFQINPVALQEEYRGNPSLIAQLFDVNEGKVTKYLTVKENETGRDTHYKLFEFWMELGIVEDDRMYQEALDEADENWSHLVFVRSMTSIELKWRERWADVMPFASPPLWVNREGAG